MHSATDEPAPALTRARQTVTRLQVELIRAAFLLTGDAEQAEQLASATLLDHLTNHRPSRNGYVDLTSLNFPDDEPAANDRRAVLLAMGRRYLEQIENTPQINTPQHDDETERGRLLTALTELEPTDRLALVLRDYDQIGEERVARLLEELPYSLRARLEPARQSIRAATRTPDHVSLRTLLDVAASGAPLPRLWPIIEAPLEEQDRQRKQRRRRITWAITTAIGLALAIGVIWLITGFGWLSTDDGEVEAKLTPPTAIPRGPTPTPAPTPSPTPLPNMSDLGIPAASVPTDLMIDVWTTVTNTPTTQQEQQTASFVYDVESQRLGEPIEALDLRSRMISPDGSKIMILASNQAEETSWIKIRDLVTGEELWRRPAAWGTWIDQFVFTDDRLIALNQDEPSELVAYDIDTGEILAEKQGILEEIVPDDPGIDIDDAQSSYYVNTLIFATPQGDAFWIFGAKVWSDGGPARAWSVALASFNPADLSVTAIWSKAIEVDEDNYQLPSQYWPGGAFWTPDGSALVHVDVSAEQIYFQTPTQTEPETLLIPFTTREPSNTFALQYTRSNSGRYLYVLAPLRREIAVVDLLTRNINLVAPIDTKGYVLSSTDANLPTAMLLSREGTRLYVANRWSLPTRDTAGSPITVIDTTTWQVIDQWELPVQVLNLIPEDHGNVIAAEYIVMENGQWDATDERGITTMDATTGEMLSRQSGAELGLPDWTEGLSVSSYFNLYRNVYGRSPMLEGTQYVDAETTSSLPRVDISLSSESAVAGVPVQIEAQVIDPRTGDPLHDPDPAVRFDPDSFLSVRLIQNDDDIQDVIIVLRRDEDGVYRGTTTLEAGGRWDAIVTIYPPDADPLSVLLPSVVTVIDSLAGTNGRQYIMVAQADPEQPAAERDVTFTVRVINAESRKRIGKGIDLEGGLPETVDLLLNTGNDAGFTTVHLHEKEHGLYDGVGEFWGPGLWSMQVRYQSPETQRYVYFQSGTIDVTLSP